MEESTTDVQDSEPVIDKLKIESPIKKKRVYKTKKIKELEKSKEESKKTNLESDIKQLKKKKVYKTKEKNLKEKVKEEEKTVVEESETVVEESETVVEESETVVEEVETVVEEVETVVEEVETVVEEAETVVEEAETVVEEAETVMGKEIKELKPTKNITFELTKEEKKSDSYIVSLLNENTKNNLFDTNNLFTNNKEQSINDEELENKINSIVDNLKTNIVNEYTIKDVKDTFSSMTESAILVQIINNKLFYLEKKSDKNKNCNIINQLFNLTSKYLINDTTFIIDTCNKPSIDKNYILRFNKYRENKNLLLVDYNLDKELKMKDIKWEDKKDRIYINEKYISQELYGKIKYILKKEEFDFNSNSDYEEINEYKYILYENTLETIDYEVDLLRLNTIMIKIDVNSEKIETFYSNYFKENEHYLSLKIDDLDNLDDLVEYKENINELDSFEIVNKLYDDSNYLFSSEIIYRYMKNVLSRLSLKCNTEQLISKRIFVTNKENNYLHNRLTHNDNIFEFHFQGKDFEIMIKDGDKKLNILANETVTNIYFNNNNIFNYRIPGLVSDKVSSNYTFIIRNKVLHLYKNRTIMLKEVLPSTFNIESLSIRTFNKDSWWIC